MWYVTPQSHPESNHLPPPPPHPYQFLQKLLMREQIDIKTWIWYVTPQCHLKLRIKPTPHPVNFAKIPYERMDWHKDLKFGMWHHKNIFSLSFQKWSLWGVPKKNLEKCSISYSKIVILGCKDYEKSTLFINFLDWHKIILNSCRSKKGKNLKCFNFIF